MNATIAQQRLVNQGLSTHPFADAPGVIQALGAVQAQDYAGARWAIGLRMAQATDALVAQAYADGELLRTHVLRPTWHFVHPADIHWLLALTAPRVHVRNAPYYRRLELDRAVIERSAAAVRQALHGGHQATRDGLRVVLEERGIPTSGPLRMSYLLMHLELDGVVCSGSREGNQHTYALLDERVPPSRRRVPADPAAELAQRYFVTRGPATVQDFAKWSGLTLATARRGLAAVTDGLERHEIAGQAQWGPAPPALPAGPPAAYLLSIYDEYISSYADRSAMVAPPDAARLQALGNALTGIVVLAGQVVGTWKRALSRAGVAVTPALFRRLSPAEQEAVTVAIERYAAFLEQPLQPA